MTTQGAKGNLSGESGAEQNTGVSVRKEEGGYIQTTKEHLKKNLRKCMGEAVGRKRGQTKRCKGRNAPPKISGKSAM